MSDDKRTIRHLKRVIEALKNDVQRLTIDKERMALRLAEERERVYFEAENIRHTRNSALHRMQIKKPKINKHYKVSE